MYSIALLLGIALCHTTTMAGMKRINRTTRQLPRGPVSFPTLAMARMYLRAPSDANYVVWNPAWPIDRDLEDVCASLGANDILVLPERPEPYIVDASEGFRANGVATVTGRRGELPIVSTYHGSRPARTWFAMVRAQRGILGLGPGAVIRLSQSSWTQERQIEDAGSTQADGWVSPGRFWTNLQGVKQGELVGAMEKVIEAAHDSPYFGNFTLRGRDLGGVAYSAIGLYNPGLKICEHLDLSNGWRGFMGMPNGETGAISATLGTYLIDSCIAGTRDDTGTRVATSPVMVNNSTGGTIRRTDARDAYAGMTTIWRSTGKHTLIEVNNRFNQGSGINLEDCQAGFELEWIGGSNYANWHNAGGKGVPPSDAATFSTYAMHMGLNATGGSAKITLRGVDLDTGPTPGALCVQIYGTSLQQASDISCRDTNGSVVPVQLYY